MTVDPTAPAETLDPVRFNVLNHRLVGGFLARLASAPEESRPTKVSSFMTMLAAHVEDTLKLARGSMNAVYAGSHWRLPGVLEVFSINQDATVSYTQDRRDRMTIRLPEKTLLDEARSVAKAFDSGDKGDQLYIDRFYYEFQSGKLKNEDFLDCRIADYAFSKCR
jgi:hypothetical protein